MKALATIVMLLAIVTGMAVRAEEPRPVPRGPEGPPFQKELFPPDLVLRNQIALDLTTAQLDAIKKRINETHAKVLDIQTELERVTEQLGKTLERARVDEATALAQADQALALESRVKKAQLQLLVQVKNILSETQQDKLRDLRPSRSDVGEPR